MATPPFQPAPGVAQLVAQYAGPAGDTAENVHHIKTTGTWTTGNLSALCDAYVDWWNNAAAGTTPKALVTNEYTLSQLIATDLGTEAGLQITKTPVGGPTTGTVSNYSNAGLTIAVKWVTGVRGKSFVGRTFFIGLDRGNATTDQNSIIPGYAASLIAAFNNLRLKFPATNGAWSLVVLSRSKKGINEVTGFPDRRSTALDTAVTGVGLTDLVIDFQRRRAPAHGRHG